MNTFQNDIKLKKFKKKKILQQMISKGDTRIRNLSRSNITNKIDYHKLYQEKRDKKIDANNKKMKTIMGKKEPGKKGLK